MKKKTQECKSEDLTISMEQLSQSSTKLILESKKYKFYLEHGFNMSKKDLTQHIMDNADEVFDLFKSENKLKKEAIEVIGDEIHGLSMIYMYEEKEKTQGKH